MTEATFHQWGLETGLAVTALLLLVLFTRRAVAQHFGPRLAYALWLLPVLRLVWPATVIPAHWLPAFLRPKPNVATPSLPDLMAYDPVPYFVPREISPVETGPDLSAILMAALPALWVAGALVGLVWVVLRHRRYERHLTSTTRTVGPVLQTELDRAARLCGLKTPPTCRESLVDDGPCVSGLFRPVIVLPHDFMCRFSPEQRRLALIHEMTHIRRGDLWTASAMMAFRLINWPNPLVHWAWPRFRADQEAACDATVLRCVGDTERAIYAETLLTAATTSGRASPVPGTGLTLSLHHPVKERLMTLGMDTKRKHIARWALASTLLAGTALTAPLSLADDPTTTEVEKTVTIVVDGAEVDGLAGLEHISEENTFVFVNRNGTTGNLSGEALEEFLQEHGALAGEPGLQALTDGTRQTRSLSISRINNGEGQSFEVRKENGETRAFRIEEDGTKTEIDVSEVEGLEGLDGLDGLDALDRDWTARAEGFPRLELETENIIGLRSGEGDGQVRVFRFSDGDFPQGLTPGEDSGRFAGAMADARLRSAESMIESSTRMIEQMRESAEGSDRDLRDAERELRRAQRALEKAQEAMERHNAE